jgi:hypothetical protein
LDPARLGEDVIMHFKTLAASAALSLMVAGGAHAATEKFMAKLDAATENPANDSKGMGMVNGTLDTATKMFNYDITYSGLTGPAMAAHFHGPAAPGANAPPALPVPAGGIMPGMIHGSATLTDAQISDLEGGKWYFNIHTAAHGGGEVRGQVMMAK